MNLRFEFQAKRKLGSIVGATENHETLEQGLNKDCEMIRSYN